MLILKKEKKPKSYNVVTISADMYEQVKVISQETGIAMGKIVEQALAYALSEYEVEEE